MRNIFEKRLEMKPYEYPELLEFRDAIRHSYWLHTEFNFTSDIQDYRVNITEEEREVLKRCMLAISQVEVTVKRFWADIYKYLPKPEIDEIGITFAESEVRHSNAYSFLLEKLGLDNEFKKIKEIHCLMKRIEYMEEFMRDKEERFISALTLFSMFVEHISLFSQFLIIMSFNKHKNLFKGISNAVEATSKEEEIHGNFGMQLFQLMKEEQPHLFNEALYEELSRLSSQALMTELEIIDWIFEKGDLEFMNKKTVKNYITQRYNNILRLLGSNVKYVVDEHLLETTKWFDIEVLSTKENDFFYKRSIDYTKKNKGVTAQDLFE